MKPDSYTAFGKASLLPHKTLAYKEATVLVDRNSGISSERDGILHAASAMS